MKKQKENKERNTIGNNKLKHEMNNINVQQSQEQHSSNHPIALDEKAELIYASAFNDKPAGPAGNKTIRATKELKTSQLYMCKSWLLSGLLIEYSL